MLRSNCSHIMVEGNVKIKISGIGGVATRAVTLAIYSGTTTIDACH